MTLTLEYVMSKSAKKLEGLLPVVRTATERLIQRSFATGIPIVITQGLRTVAEQNELYAQGRSKPGQVVTNASGGYSFHNFGVAVDFALLLPDGRSVSWDTSRDGNADRKADWMQVVSIGKALGFEWGGDWTSFRDLPHFQMTFGLSTAQYRAGKRPSQAQIRTVMKRIGEGVEERMDKAAVTVNGKKIEDGVLIGGTVFVPLRAVGDALDLQVGWDNQNKTASLTDKSK
ncbi:M15 family metallopeptidase [Paenibacillus sp. P96]|uniref:M15 family metallopeptidase n=1 Tax=Paenibacillus zeirhizosphaerae TaxID=2987519 RepID=A0ABT9FLS1_9BACL|nr:M15 family metallopeptidase [Paenibacillus sp. P96]MDP4095486.1 M15 family metallopeptidase [Paenibacillus sp. P96]